MPNGIPIDTLYSNGDWEDKYYDEFHEWTSHSLECHFPIVTESGETDTARSTNGLFDMSWNDEVPPPTDHDTDGPEVSYEAATRREERDMGMPHDFNIEDDEDHDDWVALENRIVSPPTQPVDDGFMSDDEVDTFMAAANGPHVEVIPPVGPEDADYIESLNGAPDTRIPPRNPGHTQEYWDRINGENNGYHGIVEPPPSMSERAAALRVEISSQQELELEANRRYQEVAAEVARLERGCAEADMETQSVGIDDLV